MLGITETAGDPIISISHEYLACKKRNIILFIHSEHTNKRIVYTINVTGVLIRNVCVIATIRLTKIFAQDNYKVVNLLARIT